MKYVALRPLLIDSNRIKPGDVLNLPEERGEALVKTGAAARAGKEKPPAPKKPDKADKPKAGRRGKGNAKGRTADAPVLPGVNSVPVIPEGAQAVSDRIDDEVNDPSVNPGDGGVDPEAASGNPEAAGGEPQ